MLIKDWNRNRLLGLHPSEDIIIIMILKINKDNTDLTHYENQRLTSNVKYAQENCGIIGQFLNCNN